MSGGQRILIIYLLIAIINANINSKIVLHSEDGSIAINIPSILLLPFEIDSVDKEILRYAKEKKILKVKDAIKTFGISSFTFWRRDQKLENYRLLIKKKREYMN